MKPTDIELASLRASVQTLKDEVMYAHVTSPALLVALEEVSTKVAALSATVEPATVEPATVEPATVEPASPKRKTKRK